MLLVALITCVILLTRGLGCCCECGADIFRLLTVKLLHYNCWLECEMTEKDSASPTIVQSNLKLLLEQSSIFPLIGK